MGNRSKEHERLVLPWNNAEQVELLKIDIALQVFIEIIGYISHMDFLRV